MTQNRSFGDGVLAIILIVLAFLVFVGIFIGMAVIRYGDSRACEGMGGTPVDISGEPTCIKDFTIIDIKEET